MILPGVFFPSETDVITTHDASTPTVSMFLTRCSCFKIGEIHSYCLATDNNQGANSKPIVVSFKLVLSVSRGIPSPLYAFLVLSAHFFAPSFAAPAWLGCIVILVL